MKEIVFISGKGGTGKSTVVATLSRLVDGKCLADCDVEAPNLHLLVPGERIRQEDFYGADVAVLDPERCFRCGVCRDVCRFDAISEDEEGGIRIDPLSCEGCGACALVSPTEAISMQSVKTGEIALDRTEYGLFAHARLEIGAEGSGRLVTEVRKQLHAASDGEAWALVDGSPGIGCVVIASITGADAVVAVCEPTLSGQADLERVVAVARHFQVPAFVCINKVDLNPAISRDIEQWCTEGGVPVVGRIPFEPAIVDALRRFETPVEAGLDPIVREIAAMWNQVKEAVAESPAP